MKPKSELMKLERNLELSDTLISESKMQESESMLIGKTSTSSVKIIDKSKRAFDTSVESTRALELAIQKDTRQCSNSCTRLKSVVYSGYLMTFKANGLAPTSNLNFWFLMYSIFFSLELLMTMVFILHILNPI